MPSLARCRVKSHECASADFIFLLICISVSILSFLDWRASQVYLMHSLRCYFTIIFHVLFSRTILYSFISKVFYLLRSIKKILLHVCIYAVPIIPEFLYTIRHRHDNDNVTTVPGTITPPTIFATSTIPGLFENGAYEEPGINITSRCLSDADKRKQKHDAKAFVIFTHFFDWEMRTTLSIFTKLSEEVL